MRQYLRAFVLLLATLLIGVPHRAQAETDEVVIEALLAEIGRTLVRVRNEAAAENLPPLVSATLTVKSEVRQTATGGLSFWVLKSNAKISRLAVQTLTIGLQPPKPADRSNVSSVSDALTAAIVAAARATNSAAASDPPLRTSSIDASIKFVVDSSVGGEVGVKLLPVTAQIGGEISDVATQEIVLKFASP